MFSRFIGLHVSIQPKPKTGLEAKVKVNLKVLLLVSIQPKPKTGLEVRVAFGQ